MEGRKFIITMKSAFQFQQDLSLQPFRLIHFFLKFKINILNAKKNVIDSSGGRISDGHDYAAKLRPRTKASTQSAG